MRAKHSLFYCLCILLFFSCSKKPTINLVTSPQEAFSQALDLYNAKKYNKAIEEFQNIIFNYPGTTYGADAQFYLADAYFQKKDYQSAIPEFEFFINSFVGNQFLEDAYYKLSISYFYLAPQVGKDQIILEKTIEILDNLQEKFPETKYSNDIIELRKKIAERWAEKNYVIGQLYFKGGEYSSARIYFYNVITDYPETIWANWSRYLMGQIYEKSDSLSQAINMYQSLISDSIESDVKKLAQKRLEVLENKK